MHVTWSQLQKSGPFHKVSTWPVLVVEMAMAGQADFNLSRMASAVLGQVPPVKSGVGVGGGEETHDPLGGP